jgi:hypothetical protein
MSHSRISTRTGLRFAAAVTALGVLCVGKDAHALPLVTLWGSLRGESGTAVGDGGRVGVLNGAGEQQSKLINPYGFGLELAAGATLPMSLYLGASFDVFFGETESLGSGIDVSRSCYEVMGNVGYDFGLGPLILRPVVGIGYLLGGVETEDAPEDGVSFDISTNGTVVSPGAELIFGLGLLNVNAKVRYELLSGNNPNGLVLGLGIGVSL